MIIYHYDGINKAYLGQSQARESPLEPGVFLLPANATFTEPPDYDPSTHFVQWNDNQWDIIQIPELEPEPLPQPDLFNFLKDIRFPLTYPFLNTLATLNTSMKDDLRDAFNRSDLPSVIEFWNLAIQEYGVNLLPILAGIHEGIPLGQFAQNKAIQYNIPIILDMNTGLLSASV